MIESNVKVNYQIFDLLGKLITSSSASVANPTVSIKQKGMYICVITSADNTLSQTQKIRIE